MMSMLEDFWIPVLTETPKVVSEETIEEARERLVHHNED